MYFDHNIIDFIIKYPDFLEDSKFLDMDVQPLFSIETLAEIEKSVPPEPFLKVLDELKAREIEVEFDKNFQPTGYLTILPYIPLDLVFQNYLSRDKISEIGFKFAEQYQNLLFRSITNKQLETNLNDFLNEEEKLHHSLITEMCNLKDIISEIEDLPNEIKYLFKNLLGSQFDEMKLSLSESSKLLKDSFASQSLDLNSKQGLNAIKKLEDETSISAKELNNIKYPHIIEKISSLYKSKNIDLTNYLKKFEKSSNNFELMNQVKELYLFLNCIGYKRDEGISKKERRFRSSMSDLNHAAYGAISNSIISSDKAFLDKCSAIYEYLSIETQIIYLKR